MFSIQNTLGVVVRRSLVIALTLGAAALVCGAASAGVDPVVDGCVDDQCRLSSVDRSGALRSDSSLMTDAQAQDASDGFEECSEECNKKWKACFEKATDDDARTQCLDDLKKCVKSCPAPAPKAKSE